MSDTTVPAVSTHEQALTLAQQARVNLLMLSRPAQDGHHLTTEANAYAAAMEGITREELDKLDDVAHARYKNCLPPFGERVRHATPFSQRAHDVELDGSVESLLVHGNQALERGQRYRALKFYRAALEVAERA